MAEDKGAVPTTYLMILQKLVELWRIQADEIMSETPEEQAEQGASKGSERDQTHRD
jgi:hypothetical protein